MLQKEGVELLPSSTINFKLLVVVMLLALKITACRTAIGLAIYPRTKAYRFVKALGGARQTAQLLINATTKAEKEKIIVGLGQEIIEIEAIRQTCLN